MGNRVSCTCIRPVPTMRILDLEGYYLRHVEIPMKVAEIMLEAPGKFVSPADEILRTHRVYALRADEELKAKKLYVLFPMGRVNSRASQEEMRAVTEASRRKSGTQKGGAKVFPVKAVEEEEIEKIIPKLRVEDEVFGTGIFGHRLNFHRRWKPVLETISEAKRE